jgi:hypothetical protein
MTCQLESRRTRALTCNRFRSAATTPAARLSCMKLAFLQSSFEQREDATVVLETNPQAFKLSDAVPHFD